MLILAKHIQSIVDLIVSQSQANDESELSRLNHYVWISILMFIIALCFGAYNVYSHDYLLALLTILFSLHLVGSLFLIPKIKNITLLYHISNMLYAFLVLYMVYHTDPDNSRILWAYVYPIGTIFLFGSRLGFIYSCTLLAMIIGLFLFVPEIHMAYNISFQVRFSATYFVLTIISSWVEHYRDRYQEKSIQTYQALCFEQILLKEEIDRRKVLEQKLHYLARTDPLTKLCNRGYFLESAEKEFQRAIRYDDSICFAILDVDHFKRINDTFGHPVGDAVLIAFSNHCAKSLRETDLLARIGGEEFAFLLLHVNEEDARAKMTALQEELSKLNVSYDDGKILNVTVSIGIAMRTSEMKKIEDIYISADKKLYEAKKAGRNCVR